MMPRDVIPDEAALKRDERQEWVEKTMPKYKNRSPRKLNTAADRKRERQNRKRGRR